LGDEYMSEADLQRAICARFGATFVAAPDESKVGVAIGTLSMVPLNGLRHRPESGTCGWFIWGGETLSNNAEFFAPLHVAHLNDRCPEVVRYLGLAPGWRFLVAPGHEDVWFDESLLRA
jgi:hypothetical protein